MLGSLFKFDYFLSDPAPLSLGLTAHDFNVLFLFVKFCHYEKICAAFNSMSWKEFKELV